MTSEQKQARKRKGIVTKARRKTAIAHATIKKGSGKVRINKMLLQLVQPRYLRELIREPIMIAGDAANEVDIDVNVHGSGAVAQAVASRGAIAKALVEYKKDDKLKKAFLDYDRLLLVDDIRQREPKKPLGTGARAKKQKSKR